MTEIADLDQASLRLVETAAGIGREATPLGDFVQLYREWIVLERSELGSQQEQVAQWQMLVHCMVSAPTIGDALRLFLRFTPVVWGARAPSELRDEGRRIALVFNEPWRAGAGGLIGELWMLSLLLSTVEFLAQVSMHDAVGRVRHADSLPEGVGRLLFHAPIAYAAGEVALVLAASDLRRPVVVRGPDLPEFFRQLMPLTLGAARARTSLTTMVDGLLRDCLQRGLPHQADRAGVAATLAMSAATMRRRLDAEGTTFRAIRDAAFADTATGWLECGEGSIAEIAARLGFSDAFAFRRFFRRVRGCVPSALRRG
ncbi:MAG: AraC family transcriptional regulator [Sphingomonadales bacterium]|nr:AraC family transcriptional regulator [Sphingomonadales bacterium]